MVHPRVATILDLQDAFPGNNAVPSLSTWVDSNTMTGIDVQARHARRSAMSDFESTNGEADIVLLTVAQSELEGMMLAGAVRDAGINVLMKAGGPGMGAWASAATFEHRLYVRQDRLEEARIILQGISGQKPQGARGRTKAPRVNSRPRRKSG
jgi:hypothetical protein